MLPFRNQSWEHPLYGNLVILNSNNSMGLIRYILAFAVVVAHFNYVFESNIYFPLSSYDAVGAFFALSGFLLYGSYLRNPSPITYLKKRTRRLLPAYSFIVLSCAFFLVFTSSYNYREYFFNSDWVKYVISNLAFLNFLQPDLPGVFITSPTQAVNSSLWTMKVEILLYLTIPVVLCLANWWYRRVRPHKSIGLFVLIYIGSLIYRVIFMILYENSGSEIYNILGRQFIGQLMYFYSGVFIYFKYKWFLQHRFAIISVSLILFIARDYFPGLEIVVGPIIVSSLFIALSSFGGSVSKLNVNNISYDIYLFHFPIVQVFYQYRDCFLGGEPLMFTLICLAVICLALFSWFVIEKRFLTNAL